MKLFILLTGLLAFIPPALSSVVPIDRPQQAVLGGYPTEEAADVDNNVRSKPRKKRFFVRGIQHAQNDLRIHTLTATEDEYPAHTLDVPISHFPDESKYEPHEDGTFKLRYWFDPSYYKPGGPVICLFAGEVTGVARLPFMSKGVLRRMAEETGGMAVVLEHRYYGESWPVPDLSTANMRFLTTDQALADAEYFARNVRFPGIEEDLTAPNTAWFGYGGSYAGGFAAFLRTQYPETFYGAISSSGVTVAIPDYWEYNEPIRTFGPKECIEKSQSLVKLIDYFLLDDGEEGEVKTAAIQRLFGLHQVTHPGDFAMVLYMAGVGNWQARNWDPEVGSFVFEQYCDHITAKKQMFRHQPKELEDTARHFIDEVGLPMSELLPVLNAIGFVNATQVAVCESLEMSQDECFGATNATFYRQDDISQEWRSWSYQYCTEWGYFQTGATVPAEIDPLMSRRIDMDYASFICREAFGIEELPDIDIINKRGGFDIAMDRLGWVDGEYDPWRPAGPHSDSQPDRESTPERPWILIPKGVHHWEQNGRLPEDTTPELPPPGVADAQDQLVAAILRWYTEWLEERSESNL